MAFDIRKRAAKVLKQELEANVEHFWYLSFADDTGFKGAVIIKAYGLTDALTKVNALNINPHGEVWGIGMPPKYTPDKKYHNRLLSKKELMEFWPDVKTLGELEQEEEEEEEEERINHDRW